MDKQAAKKVIKHLAILFAIGLAYYVFFSLTGFGIPCAFRTVTTLKCPSCGVTHMFSDMLHGDFASAFKDNIFLFCTWPVIGALLIYADYRFPLFFRSFSRCCRKYSSRRSRFCFACARRFLIPSRTGLTFFAARSFALDAAR